MLMMREYGWCRLRYSEIPGGWWLRLSVRELRSVPCGCAARGGRRRHHGLGVREKKLKKKNFRCGDVYRSQHQPNQFDPPPPLAQPPDGGGARRGIICIDIILMRSNSPRTAWPGVGRGSVLCFGSRRFLCWSFLALDEACVSKREGCRFCCTVCDPTMATTTTTTTTTTGQRRRLGW